LAGIDPQRQSRLEVQQAVDERLHVQRVHQANGAQPEEASPPEEEVAERDGDHQKQRLDLYPEHIAGLDHIGCPLFHRRRCPLIQPAQVCPPESAVTRTRNIFECVRVGMMLSVIRNPRAWGSGPIEACEENQDLLHDSIQFDRAMGQGTVIPDGGSQASQSGSDYESEKNLPSGKREKRDAHNRQTVDDEEINQRRVVLSLPPRLCPRMFIYQLRLTHRVHVLSNKIAKYYHVGRICL